jgi:hypothetical protein
MMLAASNPKLQIPNPDALPNPKIPKQLPRPTPNSRSRLWELDLDLGLVIGLELGLVIGGWECVGAWDLELGI